MPTPYSPATIAILAPPDGVAPPPVSTRPQLLPFEALSWEDFERLCHRMVRLDGDIEYCARYGLQGEAQEGIDIFARLMSGRYHCLQAKRHKNFGAAKFRDAIDLFLNGDWAHRTDRFTIAVQASLGSTAVQKEIERQSKRLNERGIALITLDGDQLTDQLRKSPSLIDDFFGRAWVVALLGDEANEALGARLDGGEMASVRAQLARVYEAQFHFFDPGSFGSIGDEGDRPALTLLERFETPDILVREAARSVERSDILMSKEGHESEITTSGSSTVFPENSRSYGTSANTRLRRVSLADWLGEERRFVLLGDAGCGKSTLLRAMALDILNGESQVPEIVNRWSELLPIYIPFARWAAQASRDEQAIGIKEIVRRSLQPLLTAPIIDLIDRAIDQQRVLLLIDGLDEWGSEQSARATLSALVTTVEAHNMPVMVSGRPRGLNRIGSLPSSWKRGTVAPLAAEQQLAITERWFRRYSAINTDNSIPSDAELRTKRFVAEVARDPNLAALATVPLLLVGLITLALRGLVLPRTKTDTYDQLVRVLLEIHPINRATASGDTEPRFRHATDPDQRRAAIARLAFAVREQAGGAGMPLTRAREILRSFLASSEGFELSEAQAIAAAAEILAVNAETQGLIIEKAQDEVGFVHASFEEFLGAEYLGGWPFAEIENFVRNHASEGRWRYVIANLVARMSRRDEVESLVSVIETQECDELSKFHRQRLLGDIAVGIIARAPATSRRLMIEAMEHVETEGWMPARREALASVLKGLTDPVLKECIETRLGTWLPARLSHRASLINSFRNWQTSETLESKLWRAMHDEDRGVQRTAAAVYADRFASSPDAFQKLSEALASTRDLATAASLLECIALGWHDNPESTSLFEDAWLSHIGDLAVVGILGLATQGAATSEMRDALLGATSFWSNVSYPYGDLAAALLMKYWHSDETLIKSALAHQKNRHDSQWENDVAVAFLMEAPADRQDVRDWIVKELNSDYPFNVLQDRRIWAQVSRFAEVDPAIRSAANAHWRNPKNRLIGMYKLPHYVGSVADPEIATIMKEVLEQKKGINRHWALATLLGGWERDHPDVKAALDALIDAEDNELIDLAAFLPAILRDKRQARRRLLSMSANPELRRDLLAIGLEACDCDGTDDEAVAAILASSSHGGQTFDPADILFRAFSSNPKVRALAVQRLCEANGPCASIASAYPDDPDFAMQLFSAAVPLPVELRTQIVEAASGEAPGTMFEPILVDAMAETDPELRVRMIIAQCRNLSHSSHEGMRQDLLEAAVALGPEFESLRAAALAGLVTIGELDSLSELEERGQPVGLETGGMVEGIVTVERLICEKFEEFERAFGDNLSTRINSGLKKGRFVEVLSEAPGASSAARSAFLNLAERGEIPNSSQALRALASERPRSELLLEACWKLLDRNDGNNRSAIINAEVGAILKDQFPGDKRVSAGLVERLGAVSSIPSAIPLAIFDPENPAVSDPPEINELGRDFADWSLAAILAAERFECEKFCTLMEGLVTRKWRSEFDGQAFVNRAVEERLRLDSGLAAMFAKRISINVDPSVSGSFARYLAAAGKLDPEAQGQALLLLDQLNTNQQLPTAGYDAVADEWRASRATLLDAVTAGLELS